MRGANVDDERLLVGPQTLDDAGVVVLGEGEGLPKGSRVALVQTVDFFPPVVDDPWFYGAIACANSLSDVYAMGGRPFSALNLAGFPKKFSEEWMSEILRGGNDKLREAQTILAGGHTVELEEVQFGFAVTGLVDPAVVSANAGAQPGARLYLTKPLGVGSMTTGAKQKKISWEELLPAAESMATLNDRAAAAMLATGAQAATDITGFGLVGHARNIARASDVTLRFETAKLPVFETGLALASKGTLSGASKRGQASFGDDVQVAPGVSDGLRDLLFDAETSGGLLIVVEAERADRLERELDERKLPSTCVGEVVARSEHSIELA